MAYSAIPDTEIEPGKPGSSGLFTKMRDNPEAIAAGDAGAPKIADAAFAESSINADKLVDLSIELAKIGDSSVNNTKVVNASLDFSAKMLTHNGLEVTWNLPYLENFIIPKGVWTYRKDGSELCEIQIYLSSVWIVSGEANNGIIVSDGINVSFYPAVQPVEFIARKIF